MKNKKEKLLPNHYYHVYNRANGDDRLFKNRENYSYFLKKYQQYIAPAAHTLAYCLMPNHFHFLIQIKEKKEIFRVMKEQEYRGLKKFGQRNRQPSKGLKPFEGFEEGAKSAGAANSKNGLIPKFISQKFSHFFNGYTQAYNKKYHRKGSLFMTPFKRKFIESEEYLRKLIRYIHFNPVTAGLCSKLEDWDFSSYKSLLSNKETLLLRDEVLEWFDNRENFIYAHKREPDIEVFF